MLFAVTALKELENAADRRKKSTVLMMQYLSTFICQEKHIDMQS